MKKFKTLKNKLKSNGFYYVVKLISKRVAIKFLKKVDVQKLENLRSKTRSSLLLLIIGLAYVAKRNGDAAASSFRESISLSPRNLFAHSALVYLLKKRGQWWQLETALKNRLKISPRSVTTWFNLGIALEKMNKCQESAKAFERAIALRNHSIPADWYYRQGYSYSREGHDGSPNPDLAQIAYQSAIKADKKLSAQRFGIGVFHQARAYWPQAAEAYAQQLNTNPQDPELTYKLGMAHDRCYNWAKAALNYQVAIDLQQQQSLDPNPYWFYRLGFVFERLGEGYQSQAIEAYQRANATSEQRRPYWHYRIGYIFNQQGQYQQAAEAFLQTRENQTLPPEENTEASDHQQQINELEQALAQDTTDHQTWYKLGNAYERMQNWPKAAEAYQHALDRQNDHTPDWYYRLGYVLMQAESYQAACEALRETRILQKPYGVPEDKFNKDAGFRQAATYTEYYERLSIKENTILYESFHGASMSCNPYAIFLHLLDRAEFKDWTHVWVVNDKEKIDKKFLTLKNLVLVKRDSDLYMRYLVSSKYLVNNNTFAPYFIRKEKQKYLNTWHGTPWKTLGKDIKTSMFEHKNVARNLLHATHFISPNEHTKEIMLEKHDIKNLINLEVLETGYPRIDLTLNSSVVRLREIKEQLGLKSDGKVILYAPTYRGSSLGTGDINTTMIESLLLKLSMLGGYDVLFRGHHMTEKLLDKLSLNINMVPNTIDSNELLSAVDILITDYSSIAFDFIATQKPIIYFAYDYEEYQENRGLYFSIDSMAGIACYSVEDVVTTIKRIEINELEFNYADHKKRFAPYDDGKSTHKLLDRFFGNKFNATNCINQKKNILLYAGALMLNGITVSLKNLINVVDKGCFSLSLAIDPSSVLASEERVEQINLISNDVSILSWVGRINKTIEDDWVETTFLKHHELKNDEMRCILEKTYKTEFNRVYGCARFDVIINFEGYVRFWALLFAFGKNKENSNAIYLHNDMVGEWKERFPSQKSVFNIYNHYDKLISVSESTDRENKMHLAATFGIDDSKFDYADNLLNPQLVLGQSKAEIDDQNIEPIITSAKPLFVNMARLSVEKGHKQLILAFKEVVQKNHNAVLFLLGDGPLCGEIQQQIKGLNLDNNVYMLGRKSNPFPYLAKADCFVFSSKHEGQGLVLLEAMILNKPIICTDFPCAHDVLDSGNFGLIVENSVNGLIQGFQAYLDENIKTTEFDYNNYQKNAINMFYEKVCGVKALTHDN
jgi:CDP-glycerol glycerophosphotransferase